jgi:hypothetical protein
VSERVVVELPLCARVRDVHEPGKTSMGLTDGESSSEIVARYGMLPDLPC